MARLERSEKPTKRATLGTSPDSPQKKRKKKNRQAVDLGIQAMRLDSLKRKLEQMSNAGKPTSEPPSTSSTEPASNPPSFSTPLDDSAMSDMTMDPLPPPDDYLQDDDTLPPPSACSPVRLSRRDEEEDRNRRWNDVLRTLVDPLLGYWDRTVGKYPEEVALPADRCSSGACIVESVTVQTIHFNRAQIPLSSF
ncbi:hypothetical protein PQX77_004846 [Marasmius sp. AFHP31]|nr:hypothetical protein PQX77_019028 [Marasmius sp. AFHP31]KAK1218292.1 hypothetical protein PQX77_019033 [Marasmius sp. AFHP31]KAK1232022.1 hypothetical protein PQX77_004846 [Marasmius sp. AFHP31]